jgi:hypothetical protein
MDKTSLRPLPLAECGNGVTEVLTKELQALTPKCNRFSFPVLAVMTSLDIQGTGVRHGHYPSQE